MSKSNRLILVVVLILAAALFLMAMEHDRNKTAENPYVSVKPDLPKPSDAPTVAAAAHADKSEQTIAINALDGRSLTVIKFNQK